MPAASHDYAALQLKIALGVEVKPKLENASIAGHLVMLMHLLYWCAQVQMPAASLSEVSTALAVLAL